MQFAEGKELNGQDILKSIRVAKAYNSDHQMLLAEKVETYEELEEALDIGYSLFQGFFFCKPEVLERTQLPSCKVNYLRFLSELGRPGPYRSRTDNTGAENRRR